jgi:hypothetical protein
MTSSRVLPGARDEAKATAVQRKTQQETRAIEAVISSLLDFLCFAQVSSGFLEVLDNDLADDLGDVEAVAVITFRLPEVFIKKRSSIPDGDGQVEAEAGCSDKVTKRAYGCTDRLISLVKSHRADGDDKFGALSFGACVSCAVDGLDGLLRLKSLDEVLV